MVLRDLLVLIDGSVAGQGRLRLARNIARYHHASLSAVYLGHVEKSFFSVAEARLGGGFSADRLTVRDLAVIPNTLDPGLLDWMGCYGSGGDCHLMEKIDLNELIALAKAADLAVVGQIDTDANNIELRSPEKLVLSSGRPVLMVPYIGHFAQVGRRVLVGWDGSRAAVRALNDAIPLITNAEEVILLTVRGSSREFEQDEPLLEAQVQHLSKHGIFARIENVHHYGEPVSSVLLSKSVDFASDLLVAGATHHSQLRQMIIGGVSRDLFQQMTLPVLMSH